MHSVYNVATGVSSSLNDVIHIFNEISGQTLNVQYKHARQGDIKESRANIDKLLKMGYYPKNNLHLGLSKYWNSL
ncbi:hypothetical protein GCM10022296_20390 [Secundilactobacillus similis DSM 23365 = JCM 2765]